MSVTRKCSPPPIPREYRPPEPFTFEDLPDDKKEELRAQIALRRTNIKSQTLASAAQEALLNYTQEYDKATNDITKAEACIRRSLRKFNKFYHQVPPLY